MPLQHLKSWNSNWISFSLEFENSCTISLALRSASSRPKLCRHWLGASTSPCLRPSFSTFNFSPKIYPPFRISLPNSTKHTLIIMPRQSRGRAAPSRPTAAPARAPVSTSTPQTRPASTAAYPPAGAQTKTQQAPPQQQTSQGPGLFGQMASTAAYVSLRSPTW